MAKQHQQHGAKYFLFLTHHLLAASKQSDLRAWTKELALVGLAKRGYPGVILLTAGGNEAGSSADQASPSQRLEEVARRIKRWASRDPRPIQALSAQQAQGLQSSLAEQMGLSNTRAKSRQHELVFVDSMKAVSEILRRADSLAPPAPKGQVSSSSDRTETWACLWRREMKPG